MPRYIDAEKIEIPKGFFNDLNVPKLLEWLNKQPTADVQEVRHGRWLASPDGVCSIRCSACNTPALWCHGEDEFGYAERRYASYYCPYCGARMDGEIE